MALPSSARLPPFLSTLIRPAVTYTAPDTPHTHTRVKLGAAKKKKKEIRQNEKTKQKQTLMVLCQVKEQFLQISGFV